jgi:hypothetical protein
LKEEDMHVIDQAVKQPSSRTGFNSNQGAVLVSGLMIMAGLMILGIAAMTTTTAEHRISGNHRIATQSFYAAEAGVKQALSKLIRNIDTFRAKPTVADLGMLSAKPDQANFMENYAYWISNLEYDSSDPPGYVIIEGDGAVMGTPARARVAVRLDFDVVAYLFDNGIFADQSITIGGTGDIDSYNSCQAAYDPDNPGSNADVGTNSPGSDSITMNSQAVIHGDAYIGPNGDPTVGITGGTVTGNSYALQEPKTLYPITDPGAGETLTMPADVAMTLSGGTYRLSELTLDGSDTLTINGDVTLIVDGPLTILGQAKIVINGTVNGTSGDGTGKKGGALRIFANSDIDIGGNGIVNLTSQPKNNLIFGTETVNDIFIHGNAEFYGAIYAPTATVTGVGTADFYGGIVAQNIETTGTFGTHQDECLGTGSGGGVQNMFRIAYWRTGGYE